MEFKETGIEGLYEIYPRIFEDDRGYFFESFSLQKFNEYVPEITFVQDNQSFSVQGVLRGLHFQKGEHAQGKLVRVVKGKVLDVAVDLRPESNTFGQHRSVILDAERHNMFYVPPGFAHGFSTLEDAVFQYKCTNLYNKASEGGIIWNDPELNIDWNLENPNVSEKDAELDTFEAYKNSLNN